MGDTTTVRYFLMLFLTLLPAEALADESVATGKPAVRHRFFTVDSGDFDSADSLNRISGGDYEPFLKADLSRTYESDHHYGAGPFDYERAQEARMEETS